MASSARSALRPPSIACGAAHDDERVYRLNMFDAAADGWQSAASSVYPTADDGGAGHARGALLTSGTLSDGAYGVAWLCLADYQCYDLVVDGGSPGRYAEISFEVRTPPPPPPPLLAVTTARPPSTRRAPSPLGGREFAQSRAQPRVGTARSHALSCGRAHFRGRAHFCGRHVGTARSCALLCGRARITPACVAAQRRAARALPVSASSSSMRWAKASEGSARRSRTISASRGAISTTRPRTARRSRSARAPRRRPRRARCRRARRTRYRLSQ